MNNLQATSYPPYPTSHPSLFQTPLGNTHTPIVSQFQNGLVTNLSPYNNEYKDFPLFQGDGTDVDKDNTFKNQALGIIQTRSPLSDLYFSNYNINRVQNLIKDEVLRRSDGQWRIGRQSDWDLQVIMRGIFLQYGQYLCGFYKEQVDHLNKLVVDYCAPQIISEIQQYVGYLHAQSHMYMPMERPLNVSNAGTRTLRSVTTTF